MSPKLPLVKSKFKTAAVIASNTTFAVTGTMLIAGAIAIVLWSVYMQWVGSQKKEAETLVKSYQHHQKLAEKDRKDVEETISRLPECDVYCQWMQYATDR